MFVSKKELLKLFTESKLVETKKFEITHKSSISYNYDIHNANNLTPISKLIYDSVSSAEKDRLIKDFQKDNISIDLLDLNDPDYIDKLNNNNLGFYMEDFVCHHFKCPNCLQKSLKKYAINNMPAVDLICTNFEHHTKYGETFLFQIKISLDHNSYFSKHQEYILTGSKKYGYNCHEIFANESADNKLLLINYICLELNQKSDNVYHIDKKNSFILIPDLKINTHNKYYQYDIQLGKFSRNKIKWNSNLVKILNIIKFCEYFIVDTNIVYNIDKVMQNPYNKKFQNIKKKIQFAGYYYKYLKYKSKYLSKKLNINLKIEKNLL